MKIHSLNTGQLLCRKTEPAPKNGGGAVFADRLHEAGRAYQPASDGDRLPVGVISNEEPTVSEILINHENLGKETWEIVFSAGNRGKNFTRMQPGTMVFMDRESRELSWEPCPVAGAGVSGRTAPPAVTPVSNCAPAGGPSGATVPAGEFTAAPERPDPFSANLVRAVQPYYGKPYREIDCYGLVVRGLRQMGVQYQGQGGLQDQLMRMAAARGLPENAYLNGEGLIELSGEKVFARSFARVENASAVADQVYREMAPLLQQGYILSFSTPTRGHTGIISQRDQLWTFINSGRMDNQLDKAKLSYGVGEEPLAKEINNWCKVAAANKEPLTITLGRLQEEKLRMARGDEPPSPRKIM
ncbi:MAG: hypothetical protein HY885_13570 [Deltaproteobacteria bacterium]|nr:hypothetical protein [Deltaproteobacteria bacterium]